MADKSFKIHVFHQHESGGNWALIQNARASYGPHGESFYREALAHSYGEKLADKFAEALLHFGRAVASGYPIERSEFDFEDGNGKWAFQAVLS